MGLFNRIIDKMVSDKVPFKKRKRLIVFVAIITLLSMTTATVAWFTVNTFAGVDKLDLNISLAAQLKVSMENHGKDLEKYGKVITNEMIDEYLKKHGASLEDTVLDPVTTRECTEFTNQRGTDREPNKKSYHENPCNFNETEEKRDHLAKQRTKPDEAEKTMMSTRVEKQYMAIKSAEKRYPSRMIASFCGSEVNDITAGKKYRIDPNDLWNANAKHSFGGGTGHSMYRVADLMKLGNFDSRFSRSADSAMCILFLMNGGFYAMVPEPLIIYNFYWNKNKKDIAKKENKIFAELKKEVLADNPRNLYLQRFAGVTADYSCKKSEIKLFGVIPLLTIRCKKKKIWLRLFGFIPFIQIKNKK